MRAPLLTGGPQEWALRAGTQNVPGIAGMGAARRAACARRCDAESARLGALRDELWRRLARGDSADVVRITPANGLPNTLTVAVADVASDVLIAGLDLAGYASRPARPAPPARPSRRTSCARSASARRYGGGVVRISMGHATTEPRSTRLAAAFVDVVRRARKAA